MATENPSREEELDRELAASMYLLDGLSVTDRIHVRAGVDALSRAIDEIRIEQKSIADTDPHSHLGPLLADRIGVLQDLRLRLLFAVVFGDVEILENHGSTEADPALDGNIVVDGVALAHQTLF